MSTQNCKSQLKNFLTSIVFSRIQITSTRYHCRHVEFKKNNRERFISQKRTILINESEHVNSIIQFDEIVVNRSESFLIEENQDDLNESDHDD